jgi:hypothetical protein
MIVTSMITTSPIYMINAYRVNNDYYRVDATRRILGGQQGSPQGRPRQPRRSSIARSAYNQAAQTKASGLSTLLKSAQNVKQSAVSRAIANPTQFQSQMQAYLPIPEIGLLLDRFM